MTITRLEVEVFDSRQWSEPSSAELSEEELATLASRRHPIQRLTYRAAHVRLRQLLARRVGVDAAALRFRRGRCPTCGSAGGRTELAWPPVQEHFSISHSDWLVAVAVAGAPVGVDVQVCRPGVDGVVDGFHPVEQAQVAAAPARDRAARITRCWTRKEAVLKCRGEGIAHGMEHPVVGAVDQWPVPGFSLDDLVVPQGFFGAVAVARGLS